MLEFKLECYTLGQRGGRTDLKKGWAGQPNGPRLAGLAHSFAASCPSFSPSLLESSRVYAFHDCTPLDVVIFEISSRKRIGWKILP